MELRVLFSSAGRRVELMERFRAAADRLRVELTVHTADQSPATSPACRLADVAHEVPPARDPEFVPRMLSICEANRIDILVPTIDSELLPYAESVDLFRSLGTHVVVSQPSAVRIARNKIATVSALSQSVAVPRTLSLPADRADLVSLGATFVVKPIDGSSSQGVDLEASADRLPSATDGFVAQERLPGIEHTVNVFVSRDGDLVATVPHARLAVRSGEVSKGMTVLSSDLIAAAAGIVRCVPGLRGPFCFQAFLDRGRLAGVIEINARFGGGYPLADEAGAPFAEWILREQLGLPLPTEVEWVDGLTMIRYDRSLFVE